MCRAIVAGGRRCGACRGAAKREYQRANYLAKQLQLAVASGTPTPASEAGNPAPSNQDVADAMARSERALLMYSMDGDLYRRLDQPAALAYEQAVRDVGELIGAQADALIETRCTEEGVAPAAADPAKLTSAYATLKLHTSRWQSIEGEVRAKHKLAPDVAVPEALMLDETLPRRELVRRRAIRDYMQQARDEIAAHSLAGLRETFLHKRRSEIRRAAYLEVLSRYRRIGGKIHVRGKTPPRLAESMDDVAAVFPADWVTTSNTELPTLGLTHSDHRGSYTHEAKTIPRREKRVIALAADHHGDGTFADFRIPEQMPAEWEVAAKFGARTYHRQNEWGSDGQPTGRQRWVIHTMEEVGHETVSEIVSDGSSATMCHEMTHRMEQPNPKIGLAAQIFRTRRTSRPDGSLEAEHTYGPDGSGEKVRQDGFVDEYVGKTSYGTDTNHTEVVTMGAEAVFYGRFGGLVGDGYRTSDHEHRNLILGLWATA